jgi:hypothetical protein
MNLIAIILTLVIVGVLMWLLDAYVPCDPTLKRMIHAVIVIVTVIWLLQVFGIWAYMQNVTIHPLGTR